MHPPSIEMTPSGISMIAIANVPDVLLASIADTSVDATFPTHFEPATARPAEFRP